MKNSFWALSALIIATSCQEEEVVIQQNPETTLSNQLAGSVLWYQQSDEAAFLYQQAYKRAEELMLRNLANLQEGSKVAVVLDIDETVLDNSPYEARLVMDSVLYKPESWAGWVNEADADTLPGVFKFLKEAETNGAEVFYISNRKESGKEATIKNLKAFELPYADAEHVLLKTTTSDKTERRNHVLKDFKVLVYIGDQMTDFTQDYKKVPTDSLMNYFVLLPNPMYGGFEEKIYQGDFDAATMDKLDMRKNALKLKR